MGKILFHGSAHIIQVPLLGKDALTNDYGRGFSQSKLAKEAGVSLRQIQMLEQRQRDINKTQLETAVKIAKALGCKVEDLVEYL